MQSSTGLIDLVNRLGGDATGDKDLDIEYCKKHMPYGYIVAHWLNGRTLEWICNRTNTDAETVRKVISDSGVTK